MVSSFTQNKNLELQQTGDHNGTWGISLNTLIGLVDQVMGASTTFNVATGSANVTTNQLDNFRWTLTGALAGNVVYTIQLNAASQAISGYFLVDNQSTGAFTITIANVAGGRSVVLSAKGRHLIFCDGTNVDLAETPYVNYFNTTGGSSVAYTATISGAATGLANGMVFMGTFNATSGATPTLNLTMNSVAQGALALYTATINGPTRPTAGVLLSGQMGMFLYDSALNTGAGGFHVLGYSGCTGVLDNSFYVANTTDVTKKLVFDNSAFAAGPRTTTLRPPDLNATDTIVTLAANQVLTTKSLTAPTITGAPTANGATWTDLGSVTTCDINGGTIDGTTVGAAVRSSGRFTTIDGNSTLVATTSVTTASLILNGTTYTNSLLTWGKNTIWVPAASLYSRTTQGAAPNQIELVTNKTNLKTMDFSRVGTAAANVTYAQFAVEMPKSWDASTVTFKPIGFYNVSTTAAAAFIKLSGKAYAASAALDAAQGTAVGVQMSGTGTIDQLISGSESAAITISGAAAGPIWVNFEISRDVTSGSDTTANAVTFSLLGIHLYYTTNAATDA